MKNRIMKTLLSLAIAGTIMVSNANTAYASMTQAEAEEWYQKWCQENGVDPDTGKGLSGTHDELYIGNVEQSSNEEQNNDSVLTEETPVTTPTQEPSSKPKHEHKYTADLTTDPTCTEEGVMTYTCECGDTYTEPYPALGHQYKSEITKEANCIEEGEETYTCSLCGDTYVETIAMTDHVAGKEEIVREASCTEAGEKVTYCAACDKELSKEEIPATGHTLGEQELIKNATLFSKGEAVIKCTECQEVLDTISVPMETSQKAIYISVIVAAVGLLTIIILKKKKI